MEAVVQQVGTNSWPVVSDRIVKLARLLMRVFGCWHVDMSRPFSRGNEAYRTCVACGARRRFDLEQWEMVGSFYYPERNFALYARTRLSGAGVGMQTTDS